jgi:CRISPR/Cas system-associated exonuclease Cas4 (RecB family)
MKKKIILSFIAMIAVAGSIFAQDAVQVKKPHELAKETYFKLKADLSLVGEQDAKVYQVFEDYYKTQDAIKVEMRAAGNTDMERMQDNMKRIAAKRDEKLKSILTEAQLQKWITEVEPAMQAKP